MSKLSNLKTNIKFIVSNKRKQFKFCYLNFMENIRYKIINFDSTPYSQKVQLLFSIVYKYIKLFLEWIMFHKGLSIFLAVIILSVLTGNISIYALWGSVLYTFTLVVKIIHHKFDNDDMKQIDLEYFNKMSTTDGEQNVIDNYIDDCFKRYLILFEGYRSGGYINTRQENAMLKGLIETVANNLSPLMIKKLELYYGEGRLGDILAEKCYIKVTLYVATQNKNAYSETPEMSSYINEMIKQ